MTSECAVTSKSQEEHRDRVERASSKVQIVVGWVNVMNDKELFNRRKDLLGAAYRLFYDKPLHLVRGEGVWLYDADGRKYLDMYNNVPHVGHCHPSA